MRYELSERFRAGGLRETPSWRWGIYAILFAAAVGFLGKVDRFLLYAAPIAALLIVLMFAGMSKALHTPRIRRYSSTRGRVAETFNVTVVPARRCA